MASINFFDITATSAKFTISGLYSHFNDGNKIDIEVTAYNSSTGEADDTYGYTEYEVRSGSFTGYLTCLRPSTSYNVDVTLTKRGVILASYSADIISDTNDGISTASSDVNISGAFSTTASNVEIAFRNATDTQILMEVSGISSDFPSALYKSLWIKYEVYFGRSSVYSSVASEITGKSSYTDYIYNLSSGTYTLKATIFTNTIILGSLEETELTYDSGQYVYERDFIIGSGEGAVYEPDLSNALIEERSSLTTSNQVGVRVTGLDRNYPGTYTITLTAYANGTSYSSSPSIVTVDSGLTRSEDIVFKGLPSSTSVYVFGNILYHYGDSSGQIQLTGIYILTSQPNDSYYPDLDDLRVVIESIGTNRITVHANGLDPNYSYGDWEILWHIIETNNGNSDWELVYDEDIPAGSTETGSVFITELKQNTYYEIRVTVRFRYNGSWYSEYAYPDEPIKTGTDASYVPDISNQGLTLRETSAPDDYSLRLRVERLDAAYSGNWSITYYVTSNDTTVKTKTATQSGGVSNSAYTTISGLQSGTGYDVYAVVKVTVSGKTYSWTTETCWFVTSGNVAVEDTYGGALDAELVLTQGDNGTWIGAEITGLDTSYTDPGRYVWWYLNGELWRSEAIPKGDSDISYKFEGIDLQSGGQYRVTAEIHYVLSDDSDGIYTLEEWLQADEIIDFTSAVIVPDTRTSSSLVVYVAGLDTSYSRSDRSIEWYLNGTYKGRTTLRAYASTSTNYTFSSLTKSTLYTVKARIYYTSGGSSTYKDVTIQMFTLFEWDAQKVSGGDFNITASEWKKLLDYIKAVRQYKGFAAGSYTYPSKGDDFLASHYNQALNRITGISGSGYNANAVSSGDTIYASAINFLRDEINRLSEPDYE